MAYTKKPYTRGTWENVPDPSKYDGDLNLLPRFDADNMNRIENGIENALHLTADDVGAVALYENIVIGTDYTSNTASGGIKVGIMYTDKGIPYSGMGTQRGTNNLLLTSACDHTSLEKEAEFGQRGYYFPVEVNEDNTVYPVALKISSLDGKAYLVVSDNKKKHYAKNEIIPMSEYEVIHTGNAPTLVPNAIEKLPITKGGTGGNTASGAANSLMVKSIGGGISIAENSDLNSYTTVGNYVCSLTATAQSLSNCPVSGAFVMTVGLATGGSAYLYQEVTHFSTGVKYYRTYTASIQEWSDWRATYNTSNKPFVTGTYMGNASEANGTSASEAERFINLGFTPSAVFLTIDTGATYYSGSSTYYGGFATKEAMCALSAPSGEYPIIKIAEGGFNVYNYRLNSIYFKTNDSGQKYIYMAYK